MTRTLLLAALCVGCVVFVGAAQPPPGETKKSDPKAEAPPDTTKEDEDMLKKVGLKSDGPALLDYFRKRTFKEANPKEMEQLLKDLGDDEFDTREDAHNRLIVLGSSALVGLKAAETSPDAEVRRRVRDLKQRIEAKAEPAIQSATARLVGKKKPAGSAEVLLNYLPFAADQYVTEDIFTALGKVAVVAGKADPVLTAAVEDKLALKRAAAGAALVVSKVQSDSARVLLTDADPVVRLRVGLALVNAQRDKTALPVLIETLKHLNPEQVWPVEEVLVRMAGEKTPAISLGTNEPTRTACFTAWNDWYKANEKAVDLTKLDEGQALLNYTLIVLQTPARFVGGKRVGGGEVVELDHNKKVRFKFDVTTYPVDGQVVGPDRVLIAEYQGGKVSERDFKGVVKWERAVGGNPIGCQRLNNGSTFVVLQNRLIEVDRNGKETFTYNRPNHDIFRARKLPNGDVVFITNSGFLTRMDQNQKVVKSFQSILIPVLFGSIDILPNGGVIIPDFQANRVVEFDGNGKQVSSFNVQQPNSVTRLPNGNTLVASQNTRKVAEYDRAGREVWSHAAEGMVFNARKR